MDHSSTPSISPSETAKQNPARHSTRWLWILLFGVVAVGGAVAGGLWDYYRPENCYLRGREALKSGQKHVVLRESTRLLHTPGFEAQGRLLDGLLLLNSGDPASALAQLELVGGNEEISRDAYAAAAQCLYQLGRYLEAVAAAQAALSLDATNLDARRWLAAAYYDLGAISNAVDELTRLSQQAPTDPRPDRLLGLISKDGEQYQAAIEHYQESLHRDPEQPDREQIQRELAGAHIKLSQFHEALAVLEKCTETISVLILKAECRQGLGELDQARALLTEAIQFDEQNFEAHLALGKLLLVQGDPKAATRSLKTAVRLNPHNSQAHFQLSQALIRLGEAAEGAAELQQMEAAQALERRFSDLHDEASKQPNNAEIRLEIGQLARKLGKPELARMWYRAALGLNPNLPRARAELESLPASGQQ